MDRGLPDYTPPPDPFDPLEWLGVIDWAMWYVGLPATQAYLADLSGAEHELELYFERPHNPWTLESVWALRSVPEIRVTREVIEDAGPNPVDAMLAAQLASIDRMIALQEQQSYPNPNIILGEN